MDDDIYAEVNKTELVTVIAELGFHINPELPKEKMVEIIRGRDPAASELSPLMDLRAANKETLNNHWHSLQLQLVTTCKGKCREEGAACPDIMVLLCSRRMADLQRHNKDKSRSTKTYKVKESQGSA